MYPSRSVSIPQPQPYIPTISSMLNSNFNLFCNTITANKNLKKRLINDRKKHFYYISETHTKLGIFIAFIILLIFLMLIIGLFYLK